MTQEPQSKVAPRSDAFHFAQRAQDALDEGRYVEALDLILQANAVDPRSENTLLQAQILVGLGRLQEAYGLFDREFDFGNHPETGYEVPMVIAYGDAARGTGHFDRAKSAYALALMIIANRRVAGTADGEFVAIDPKTTTDPHWFQAARLSLELFYPHPMPGTPALPMTNEILATKLREIDRLAPKWDRIWPTLLWSVSWNNVPVKKFAQEKFNRLKNTPDLELRRVVRMLRKSMGEPD